MISTTYFGKESASALSRPSLTSTPLFVLRRMTVEQAIRIVVRYIDSQPARLQENFYDLAVEALRAAWRGLCH